MCGNHNYATVPKTKSGIEVANMPTFAQQIDFLFAINKFCFEHFHCLPFIGIPFNPQHNIVTGFCFGFVFYLLRFWPVDQCGSVATVRAVYLLFMVSRVCVCWLASNLFRARDIQYNNLFIWFWKHGFSTWIHAKSIHFHISVTNETMYITFNWNWKDNWFFVYSGEALQNYTNRMKCTNYETKLKLNWYFRGSIQCMWCQKQQISIEQKQQRG